MTPREKRLSIAAGAVVGLVGLYGLVYLLVLAPLRRLEMRERAVVGQVRKLARENRQREEIHERIRQIASRCFGLASQATAVEGDVMQFLSDIEDRSELDVRKLDPTPAESQPGVYEGMGFSVTASGSLDQVVNYLFLLDQQKFLYRIDRLSLQPDWETDRVEMSLRYATILPVQPEYPKTVKKHDPPVIVAGKYETGSLIGSLSAAGPDGSDRTRYTALSLRNPLLRYRKRPVRVARQPDPRPRPRPRPQPNPPRPAPQPARAEYKLTSLTRINGEPKIRIENLRTGLSKLYKVGDAFDGGTIARADYRDMPRPDNPKLISSSRIILRKGPDYWAVERGQTFSQKRLLRQDQLPEDMQPNPQSSGTGDEPAGSPEDGPGVQG